MLISSNKVSAESLKEILTEINAVLKRVLVPAGRLSVKIGVQDVDKAVGTAVANYTDVMNDTEIPAFKKSVVENLTVEIPCDPISYHLNSIPAAWNEFVARGMGLAQHEAFFDINALPAIVNFRTQISRESEKAIRDLASVKKNRVSPAVIVDVENEGQGGYGERALSLVVKVNINLTQV